MDQKVAIVTGSNKGIGFAIVKSLCEKFPGIVYLTARDEDKGRAAIQDLQLLGFQPEFLQLDVTNKTSIEKLRNFIEEKHGGIDILINNAAVYLDNPDSPDFGKILKSEIAEKTLATNYFALLDVCKALFPLLRHYARVVNISSSAGHLSCISSEELRQKFLDPNLTEADLSALMQSYLKSVKEGTDEVLGWPTRSYSASKIGVSKLTFIQQAAFDKDTRSDIIVNAVHPGYVSTDMTYHKGCLTPEEGAAAPVYLALLSPNAKEPKGAYVWHDKRITHWVEPLAEPR